MRGLPLPLSLVVLLLLGVVLVYANRRRRLLPATGAIIGVLALGWGLAARAVSVDYRDADGFADCWPSCTAFQDGVWSVLFYGPVAATILLVTALVLYAGRVDGPGASRRASREPRSS